MWGNLMPRSADAASGALLACLKLFLDVRLKLIEQAFQLGHLGANLRERGREASFSHSIEQLLLLPPKGVGYADVCFHHFRS